MNDLLKIIEINNSLKLCFPFDNIYDLFYDDYCYEYYLIIKECIPNCKLIIDRTNNHCGILINDIMYDVRGISDNNNFEIVDERDYDFINSFYKKFTDSEKERINIFLKNIKKYQN